MASIVRSIKRGIERRKHYEREPHATNLAHTREIPIHRVNNPNVSRVKRHRTSLKNKVKQEITHENVITPLAIKKVSWIKRIINFIFRRK